MQDATRTPPDAIALSLSDAAVRLGISPDAARKRLERGTLRGEKHHGRWTVYLEVDAMSDETVDATRTPTFLIKDATSDQTGRHRTPPDAGEIRENFSGNDEPAASAETRPNPGREIPTTDQPGIVPLVELVSDLARRNEALARENTEIATAAAIWQERARFLGERLAQLEAGPITAPAPERADAPGNVVEGSQRVEFPQRGNEPLQDAVFDPAPAEVQLATGWRRWFRRIMGHDG